jgi:signal transduction histidine kinase/ActR/RegA family two-component response regulator
MRSREVTVTAAKILVLAGVYIAAGKLGLSLARVHPSASAVWPPSGIAIAALLLFGRSCWPGIFIGAFLANVTTSGTFVSAVCIATGNTLEGVVGAFLIERFANGRGTLERPVLIYKFILLTALACLLSATIGVTTLCLAHLAPWSALPTIGLTWWLGDLTGVATFTPLVLLWSRRNAPGAEGGWLEALGIAVSVAVVNVLVFGGVVHWSRDNHPLSFLGLLPVVWAALRLGQRAAATASFATSAVALWGTLHGYGPFAFVEPRESLLLLQGFLGVLTIAGLLIGALVSDRHAALVRAKQARAEAETASRFKDDFLAVVSHELRNPLNVILGYADLLERDPHASAAFVQDAAAAIRRNAKAQAQVVADLLDLSRMQMGKLALNRQPLALAPLVQEAVSTMQPEARARGVTLGVEIGDPVLTVEADSIRIQQILWNLIHNAIKFTPEGGAVVVRLQPVESMAELVVEDTGTGIPPEFLPHIFDLFRQADATKTRRYGGMGIGLALVQQLTELHGGNVDASSDGVGEGARFRVRLPRLPQGTAIRSDDPVAHPSSRTLSGQRILIVEDTADVAEMLRRGLAAEGAQVSVATTAHEALQRCQEQRFDLLLSDVAMPDMDGCELLLALRARPETVRLPAIALTGFGRPNEVEATRAAGFALHLVKPVQLQQLVGAVLDTVAKAAATNPSSS